MDKPDPPGITHGTKPLVTSVKDEGVPDELRHQRDQFIAQPLPKRSLAGIHDRHDRHVMGLTDGLNKPLDNICRTGKARIGYDENSIYHVNALSDSRHCAKPSAKKWSLAYAAGTWCP